MVSQKTLERNRSTQRGEVKEKKYSQRQWQTHAATKPFNIERGRVPNTANVI